MVPPRAWEVLHTAQSYAGGGALVLTPPHTRVLVLAPHPDDEVIGCGGTTAILAAQGRTIRTLIATNGGGLSVAGLAPAEVGARRQDDARRAAEILGTPPPVFLSLTDGTLPTQMQELAAAIGAQVAEFRPDAIYAPWLLDAHPDHEALAMALAMASVGEDTDIWGYEVWGPVSANRLVEVSSVWERKERALAEHRVPATVFDTTGHLALNRWRSIHGTGGTGHVEAFFALPFSSYAEMAMQLRTLRRQPT
jgi:N-acetylglucosamine malate deacetylase 1